MSKTKDRIQRLATALELTTKANEAVPEDNPLVNNSLEHLVTGRAGVRKGSDLYPAKYMSGDEEEIYPIGAAMEHVRHAAIQNGAKDRSARRMKVARERLKKKEEFDRIEKADVPLDPVRRAQAWLVVMPMTAIIDDMARAKKAWANRLLGANVDDIASIAKESMVLILAKGDKDLPLLGQASAELGEQHERSGRIPGDQKGDKEIMRARKWLLGLANNRVMAALMDTYTSPENVRWENLDILASVMANINGAGDDPMMARFKVDRSPVFVGSPMPRPGQVDPTVLHAAVDAAITDRGLDRLVEILLDVENVRTDGSIKWADCAETILRTEGDWLWRAVVASTEDKKNPRRAQADIARNYARSAFAWLPSFIVKVMESFDPRLIGYATKGMLVGINSEGEAVRLKRTATDRQRRAIVVGDFELFYLPDPQRREVLAPKLVYASPVEAARAIAASLDVITNEDILESLVFT